MPRGQADSMPDTKREKNQLSGEKLLAHGKVSVKNLDTR
jgi:hypothetical protein